MNWDEKYLKSEVFWNKGAPSPPLRQYLERHPARGRALVPGCGHGHEVALAVEQGLDATGLDIAPAGVAEARALYPQLAERFVTGDLLIGVWFINPDLDPGGEGPPFPFSVPDLTALFAEGYEIVEDYVPDMAFDTRVGRERVRVLRRLQSR
jgi:hypothetical protein